MANTAKNNAFRIAGSQPTLNIEHGKFQFTTPVEVDSKRRKNSKPGGKKMEHLENSHSDASVAAELEKEVVDRQQNNNLEHTNERCCELAQFWKDRYINLEARFTAMEKELAELTQLKDVREVRTHFQKLYKSENSHTNEIKQLTYKLQLLSNTVIRFEEKLKEANEKITQMQQRSMRRNLIISGLEEAKNETKQELEQKVASFLHDKVGFQEEVPLKTTHRLGYTDGSGYRPVILKLADLDQKYPILAKAPQLKGQKNNKQKFFYLSEQLPEQVQEDRRYAQFWIQDNKQRPGNEQRQLKIHKNKLSIDNRPYKRKVQPPQSSEILKLNVEDLCQVKQSPTIYGDSQVLEDSEFISYAVKANKPEDVRLAYRKLRIKYADATHIISAHRFSPPNGPINQEASDDGEWGGGRCLLKCLQDLKLVNIAVFIIRYYGGRHVGAARFDLMEKLTKAALKKGRFLRASPRGPLTRSRSQQTPSTQSVVPNSPPPSRASSFGIPSEFEKDNDSDSLKTADEDASSLYSGAQEQTSDDDERSQVVLNYLNENQFASATEEHGNQADNEASEVES